MNKPITLENFKKLFPNSVDAEQIHKAFAKYFTKYEINTANRRAGFLAQCGHESNGFAVFTENLNYSSKGLLSVFKKYFKTEAEANSYARNPEKIANKVYANRMDNGSESSGDGWKFRGRGFIQLTGKYNYTLFAKYKQMTLDEVVDYLSTIEGAVESALWYWSDRGLNTYCDNNDITGMTKKINGGTNGLKDREHHYEKIKTLLS